VYPVAEVLEPGFLTTIQDQGRCGYRSIGMPVAGAMDQFAFRAANLLVGNGENAAVLEITLTGLKLRFRQKTVVAITGADLGAKVGGRELPRWQALAVEAESEISFSQLRSGCRAYLAIAGGIDVPLVLGSRSTYVPGGLGGLEGRRLLAGDHLFSRGKVGEHWEKVGQGMAPAKIPRYKNNFVLRVIMGPQEDHFTPRGKELFLNSEYEISREMNRMGIRLAGPKIEHATKGDMISDGVPWGGIQIPGNGQPIIMLADSQTIGGYPKIAVVISADWYKLAQALPGDKARFAVVSLEEARRLLLDQEKLLKSLAEGSMDGNGERLFRVRFKGRCYDVSIREI
jgi:antagonist of KipI